MQSVSLVKCSSYDYVEVKNSISKSLGLLGGLGSFVKPGQKILLKVNMLGAFGVEEAVCTNPIVVEALAELCKEQGAEVFVGDSPALDSFESVLRVSGLEEACRKSSAIPVELSDPVETPTKNSFAAKKLFFSKKLSNFDVIINVPKLKTHIFTAYTGAVKNCFGCVPRRTKSNSHKKFPGQKAFSKMLLDIYTTINPKLTVMDAVVGMDHDGPSAGKPKQIGAIIASDDGIALDFVASNLVGLDPKNIYHLSLSKSFGLCNPSEINVLGEDPEKLLVGDFVPAKASVERFGIIAGVAQTLLESKPALLSEKCVSCKKCYGICPTGAISFPEKHPKFDYSKCIRCFCCHEVCPEKAIFVKDGPLRKLLNALRKKKP